jgi:uncharacterized membrane protein
MVLLGFAIAAWYYPQLPDPVPTHWNAAGDVDGWTAKPWGVWLLPVINAALMAMFVVIPLISPKGFRLEQSRKAFDSVVLVFVVFMLGVQIFSYRSAISGGQELVKFVPMAIGLLFIILGNYMGKFQKNFFIGIRTPWTLASDQVWNRTHRLGSYVFMIGGVFMMLAGILEATVGFFIVIAIAIAMIPTVYSLVIYRQLEGFSPNDENDD